MKLKQFFIRVLMLLGLPFTILSAFWLKIVVNFGIGRITDKIFMRIGVLPIIDQYYQPLINPKKYLKKSLRSDRVLKGIDFNHSEQLDLIKSFKYNDELLKIPIDYVNENVYYYNNNWYNAGDSEFFYNIVRHYKPKRIIEVGSGYSTLMAIEAIKANKIENESYRCKHICIEPFERDWLSKLDVELVRQKVEEIDIDLFKQLEPNDILFIDSSHMIRPQGDVLYEILEMLPVVNSGVLIHIHDIFSPKDYLNEWIEGHLLWNEQYLLEAFLMFNKDYRVIGALNYLTHQYFSEFTSKSPTFLKQNTPENIIYEPRAFWIIKS